MTDAIICLLIAFAIFEMIKLKLENYSMKAELEAAKADIRLLNALKTSRETFARKTNHITRD